MFGNILPVVTCFVSTNTLDHFAATNHWLAEDHSEVGNLHSSVQNGLPRHDIYVNVAEQSQTKETVF